jgi:hypothetical protein
MWGILYRSVDGWHGMLFRGSKLLMDTHNNPRDRVRYKDLCDLHHDFTACFGKIPLMVGTVEG